MQIKAKQGPSNKAAVAKQRAKGKPTIAEDSAGVESQALEGVGHQCTESEGVHPEGLAMGRSKRARKPTAKLQ